MHGGYTNETKELLSKRYLQLFRPLALQPAGTDMLAPCPLVMECLTLQACASPLPLGIRLPDVASRFASHKLCAFSTIYTTHQHDSHAQQDPKWLQQSSDNTAAQHRVSHPSWHSTVSLQH
jgi:hypothetical protein